VAWLPVVGFLIGFFAIWYKGIVIPSAYASYISLAAIAGIDTILGGLRAGLESRFESDVFLSGFIVNTIMAALLAYFGDQIGVPDLYLAAVVVLGWRIFLNLSLIRRHALGRPHPPRTTVQASGMISLPSFPDSPQIAPSEEEGAPAAEIPREEGLTRR
jgi:small basic protein